MIDIEKIKSEAESRIKAREKINRSLSIEEEDEKSALKTAQKDKKKDTLFGNTSQDMLSQRAMLVVMQYLGRAFMDVFHSSKDIVTQILGKRETMTENTPLALTYDKTLSILQELERQMAINKSLDEKILNDEFLREKIRDINPARFEENLKTLEDYLHELKNRDNFDINDYFFKVWEEEQKLREAQQQEHKDVIDAEIINDKDEKKDTQGDKNKSESSSENKQINVNRQNLRRNK